MSDYNSNNGFKEGAYRLASTLSTAAATGFGIAGLRHAYGFYQSADHSIKAALSAPVPDLALAAGLGAAAIYTYRKAQDIKNNRQSDSRIENMLQND